MCNELDLSDLLQAHNIHKWCSQKILQEHGLKKKIAYLQEFEKFSANNKNFSRIINLQVNES